MIYQAIGYKRTLHAVATTGPQGQVHEEVLRPVRRGTRTTHQNVARAETDHLSQRYPDLIWGMETVGASQQVRR